MTREYARRLLQTRWGDLKARLVRERQATIMREAEFPETVDPRAQSLTQKETAVVTLLHLIGAGRHTAAHVTAALEQLEREVTTWPTEVAPQTGLWESLRDLIEWASTVCRGPDRRRVQERLRQLTAEILQRRRSDWTRR